MKKISFLLAIILLLSCFVSCNVEETMTMSVQITEINGNSVTARVLKCSAEAWPTYVKFTIPDDTQFSLNDTVSLTYTGKNTASSLEVSNLALISSGNPGDRFDVEDNEENREAGKKFTCVIVTLEQIFDSYLVGKNFEEDDGITYVIDFNPEFKSELMATGASGLDIVLSGAIYDASKKIVRATAENYQEMPNIHIPDDPTPGVCYKPVIYLYPTATAKVDVKLTGLDLTCTYPAYNDGWKVTAQPDGTLTDESGKTYSYLYWEGITSAQWDFSNGFCIKGCDTAEFLEEALEKLGLTRREANEFIVYWLPLMQDNEYNVISFQTDVYTEAAKLEISPAPDTLIRVFMTWYASDTAVEIEEQELSSPARDGFVAVEWGGSQVK